MQSPEAISKGETVPEPIYLDHNATTQLDPAVLETMLPYLQTTLGNPSSRHIYGRRARQAIDHAKVQIARGIGCEPDQVIFTSGATEANNLAIHAMPAGSEILVNASEHPSAIEPARRLQRNKSVVREIPNGPDGVIPSIKDQLTEKTQLVVVQFANSETGCLQPIQQLASECPPNCFFHCDATQAVGKVDVNFAQLGVTSLCFSGHKLHGPSGIGALILKEPSVIRPLSFGGHQQQALRPGTEPVASIVGLGKAVEIATTDLHNERERLQQQRDLFESLVLEQIPDVELNSTAKQRLPNTTNLSFLGAKAEGLLMALDLAGIGCSSGTACASGSMEPSPVLLAMGLHEDRIESALRFSVGRFTTVSEVEEAVHRLARCCKQIRQSLSIYRN